MSKREKSELRDPEEGPKTPIKSKPNSFRLSKTPEKAQELVQSRLAKLKSQKKKKWNFGSPEKKKSREHGITNSQTKHDFTNSQTKRIRYQTPKKPQKKKRGESNSTSNQTKFSPTDSPPKKRTNKTNLYGNRNDKQSSTQSTHDTFQMRALNNNEESRVRNLLSGSSCNISRLMEHQT